MHNPTLPSPLLLSLPVVVWRRGVEDYCGGSERPPGFMNRVYNVLRVYNVSYSSYNPRYKPYGTRPIEEVLPGPAY